MKKGDMFPRCLINLYHRICCSNMLYYYNDYDSWEEASKAASSYGKAYESKEIIKRVSEATEVVRQGRADLSKMEYFSMNIITSMSCSHVFSISSYVKRTYQCVILEEAL